jgi:UTP--glucose-1-phosphate uridylyltransferase
VITDAVIPVAGLGTRLLPITRSVPKEMLPLVDKPVVQYVVEELVAAGIRRIVFVTGQGKQAIEDYFQSGPVEFLYTRQPEPRGLGDALRYAEGFAPAVVALGDAVIEGAVVPRLISAYEGADAAVAVAEVPEAAVSRYGIVVSADGEVTDLVEKPAPGQVASRMAVMGRYVLGPRVFAALRETQPGAGGEVQLTDALRAVLGTGGRIRAVPLADGERRHDVGTVEGYCATFGHYARLRFPDGAG